MILPTKFIHKGKRAIPVYESVKCMIIVNDSCKRVVQFFFDRNQYFGNAVRKHEWHYSLTGPMIDSAGRLYWVTAPMLWPIQINAIYSDYGILKLMIANWVRFWIMKDMSCTKKLTGLGLKKLYLDEEVLKIQDNW